MENFIKSFLLASVVWVTVGAEAAAPIGEAVPTPIAMAAALYTICQSLQAFFPKDFHIHKTNPMFHLVIQLNSVHKLGWTSHCKKGITCKENVVQKAVQKYSAMWGKGVVRCKNIIPQVHQVNTVAYN